MNNPEASVIIPTRNRAWILKHCLDKLFNQSVDNYEIIIIDDASEDETPRISSEFRVQSSEFKEKALNSPTP